LYLCIRNEQTYFRRLLQGKQAYQGRSPAASGFSERKYHGPYKPYAIIDKFSFEATIGELKKGTPL
jgi:hypothetical protein